jgi:uncharacterized protein
MPQPAKASQPNMEEILASIRKIITRDDPAKTAPPEPASPFAAPDPAPGEMAHRFDGRLDAELRGFDAEMKGAAEKGPDILELTPAMRTSPVPARAEPPEVVFDESLDGEAQPSPLTEPQAAEPPPSIAGQRPLLSPRTVAAVDMAFNSLAHTVLVQNSRTLEDLVREMLKPMLKAWLDDHLPDMVERLVRAEIERVSSGRG